MAGEGGQSEPRATSAPRRRLAGDGTRRARGNGSAGGLPRSPRCLPPRARLRTVVRVTLTYALLIGVSAVYVLPLVGMVSATFKTPQELKRVPPTLLPDGLRQWPPQLDLRAYGRLFQSVTGPVDGRGREPMPGPPAFDYPLYARNTLLILVLSLAGVLVSNAIAAYGFARVPFRGRNALFAVCLATMMIPFPVIMVPSYILFKHLGWIGTLAPLWVPAWFGSAFNIFLLRQFFLGIPKELEESAMLDGCSRWGCFWRIMLPLSRPALAVVALFHCLAVWNDLVGPLIYLTHQDQFTLALGLQFLQSKAGDTPWNQLMAAATLVVLPVLVLFLLAQRTFVRGIATTGIKG